MTTVLTTAPPAPLASPVPLLKHPGPIAANRLDALAGRGQKTYRIDLRAGETLYDCVVGALKALDIGAAALSIPHAAFDRLSYYQIASDPAMEQVAHYSTPLILTGPSLLVGCGATIGTTAHGEPAIHCHGLAVNGSGDMIGGHFLTEDCVIAGVGSAYISALGHMDLIIGLDPEIKTPVFQPRPRITEHHANH